MGKMMRAIGLMSGTSMDGIDVALIDTDGESRVERGPAQTFLYDPGFRARWRRPSPMRAASRTARQRPGCLWPRLSAT